MTQTLSSGKLTESETKSENRCVTNERDPLPSAALSHESIAGTNNELLNIRIPKCSEIQHLLSYFHRPRNDVASILHLPETNRARNITKPVRCRVEFLIRHSSLHHLTLTQFSYYQVRYTN